MSSYKVVEIPGAGRGLAATRDIDKGEVILNSIACVTGPCARCPPCCVACLKLISPSQHNMCPKCLLLVCSTTCRQSTEHEVECKILSLVKAKMKRVKNGEKIYRESLSSLTSAVTCIRMISLKWRDPELWTLTSSLMGQNIHESVWEELKSLHETILHHEPRISLEDLRLVHGIITTNGALLHLPPGYGRGLSVYPLQALLNHSCMCNTISQDYPQDRRVEIKARFNISTGEEITTSYIRPTQDTQSRRQFLAHTWHFWCHCSRCKDPSEGGSCLGAVICPRCHGDRMLPEQPLDSETSWVCHQCHHTITAEEHEQILHLSLEIINDYPKEGITSDQLEGMLHKLSQYLSHSHWLMIEIQQKLLNIYTGLKVSCSRPIKERRIQLSAKIIDYMDKVDPQNHSSPKKLQLKLILLETKIDLMTKDFKEGRVEKEKLASLLKQKQGLFSQLTAK